SSIFAAGVHAPNLQNATPFAYKRDRPPELGKVDSCRSLRRNACWPEANFLLPQLGCRERGRFGGSGRAPRLASSISCAAEAVAIGTEAGVRIDGKLARAIRSPAFFGRAIPGAAAQHSFCARGRPLRVVTRTF